MFEVVDGMEMPTMIDDSTRNIFFGHSARVLVNVDLASILSGEILVERDKFTFFHFC